MTNETFSRRKLLALTGAAFAAPTVLRAQAIDPLVRADDMTRRNMSSFISQNWQDHFDSLGRVTILADTYSRALHYWNADGSDYRLYPTSVPRTDELTRRGYTEVVRKKVGPTWTPTANMRKEDPSLPTFMPAGEGNPLGTHALYLSWPAYLIHGTHDTRKIGRRSSSGCIGLYNRMIAELFEITPIGAQVRLL
ncbi:L,D-transpeptidase [Profundibacterium mesophilum]|uniref:ErfK/YbiS/YcfS/YnhG family protein n=1 Tax=Profundibacterium mesophilum KAUST100406-0324 TaxID=1037889 RepID=A0A921TB96_9RHOB|nr:L,D-transpeptidase family protein [Profundibacterium mesophilum]KAF0675135.1 ErfK/YbiS/YcfS/YnhG family protein [Profundibacterium mesophilum KAUST100406-0324]